MTAPIGLSVKRREDRRFLTGRGRFVDDVRLPRLVHAAIVRSPHAHARVVEVDARRARALPGVVAILTVADLPECAAAVPPLVATPKFRAYAQPAIAGPKVRHAGETVAVVLAGDAYGAADGADAVKVRYETLKSVRLPRRRWRRVRRGSSTNGPTTSRARRRARSVTSRAASRRPTRSSRDG